MVTKKKKVKPIQTDEMEFTINTSEIESPGTKKKTKKPSTKSADPVATKKPLGTKSKMKAAVTKKTKIKKVNKANKVKKEEPSTSLMVPSKTQKRISKLDSKGLKSIIGDDADLMQSMFEDGDVDQAVRLLNKRLIQTCIDLIPQLENSMRESNGRYGGHALNNTIQTVRELVIDLQQMQDRGAIGEMIVDRIIRPGIRDIATKIVEEAATVLSEIKDSVTPDVYSKLRQAQIDSRNRMASLMDNLFRQMRDETIQFLQR